MLKTFLLSGLILCSSLFVLAQDKDADKEAKKEAKKEERKLLIDQLESTGEKFSGFMVAELADSVADLFSSNCQYMPEFGGVSESREDVLASLKKEFNAGKKISKYQMVAADYKIYDDVVVEIGVNKVEYTIGQKLHKAQYNYLLVWKISKKGKCRIKAAIWNSATNPCQ